MTKCDIVRLINTSINLYLANTRISQVQVIKWLMTILASMAIRPRWSLTVCDSHCTSTRPSEKEPFSVLLSNVLKGEGEGFWKCFPHPVRGSEGRGLASVENVKPLWGKIAFANLSYANKIWFALNGKRKIVLKRKKNVMGRTRGLLKVSYSINFPYTSVWTFVKCKCAQRREQ